STTADIWFGGDGGYCAVDPTNANIWYGEYVRLQMYQSKNAGASSNYIWNGISDTQNGLAQFIAPFTLSPNNHDVLWAGGASLWRTSNVTSGAPTWIKARAVATGDGTITAIAEAPGHPEIVWIGYTSGRIYKSVNADTASPTFTAVDDNSVVDPLPNVRINWIYIDPSNNNLVYSCLSGFTANNLRKSTDGGTTWTSVSGSGATALPSAPIRAVTRNPVDATNLFAATEVGVFESGDSGATWSTSAFGPANVCTYQLNWMHGTNNVLLASTHGRGAWKYTLGTGVAASTLGFNQATVVGGTNVVATVTLAAPAPAGGQVVTLTSDQPIPDLPASVTVAAGATTKAFSLTPNGVDATASYAVHATSGGVTANATLTVNPASLVSLAFSPSTVVGGVNTSGVVTLNGYAGPSGKVVTLTSGSGKVVLPATATVGYNAKTNAFTVVTGGVATTTNTTNTAKLGATTVTAPLTLTKATLLSIALSSNTIVGGNNVVLTARLNGVAPAGGTVVTLSGPAALHVPASVTVPAGKVAGAVSFNPDGVNADTTAQTISGNTNGADTKTTTLVVQKASFVSIGYSPSTIVGGLSGAGIVKLNGMTGSSGATVTLTSLSSLVTVPASVVFPAQTRAKSFTATTQGVNTTTLTTTNGTMGATTLSGTIQLTRATALNALPNVTSIKGGSSVTVTIRLTGYAGAGGDVFTLSSSNAHAVAPANTTVLQNHNAVAFTVTTTAVSSNTPVNITCTGPSGVGTVVATFTITP
ncbi:MAG: hypothetical protein ABUL72_00505, partial [Armatimonadota bacterium]